MINSLRGRALATAAGLLVALAVPGGSSPAVSATGSAMAHDRFAGFWRIEHPTLGLHTTDGKPPPLKPEAEKTYRANQAARRAGDTSFDRATWCASLGYPRALLVDYPFEVIVDPTHVVFLHQWNWWHNIVYLPGSISPEDVSVGPAGVHVDVPGAVKVRPEEIPGSFGFSQGTWSGDTLTVRTDHTVDDTLLDSAGMPHSDDLKMTTTWSMRGPDTLEAKIHFDDPATFTRPWDTVLTFKRQAHGWEQEDVCLDRIKLGQQPAIKEVSQ